MPLAKCIFLKLMPQICHNTSNVFFNDVLSEINMFEDAEACTGLLSIMFFDDALSKINILEDTEAFAGLQ